MMHTKLKLLAGVSLLAFPAGLAEANTFTLIDANSEIVLETADDQTTPEPRGVVDWVVDGTDLMYQEFFWFRVGQTAEQPLDSIFLNSMATDTNGSGNLNNAFARYGTNDFEVLATWNLQGGQPGSQSSDLAEQVTINNLSSSLLEFTLFEYTDFDLEPDINNDIGSFNGINEFVVRDGVWEARTTMVPDPDFWEIAGYPSILNSLDDGLPTTLSNTATPFGPNDVEWAAQWNFRIPVGGTAQISKNKLISPVSIPSSVLMLLPALVGLGFLGRRRAA